MNNNKRTAVIEWLESCRDRGNGTARDTLALIRELESQAERPVPHPRGGYFTEAARYRSEGAPDKLPQDHWEPRLTPGQAAIIAAYTNILCGPFSDFHAYATRILGRPVWTHQFANEKLNAELREAAKADFLTICSSQSEEP